MLNFLSLLYLLSHNPVFLSLMHHCGHTFSLQMGGELGGRGRCPSSAKVAPVAEALALPTSSPCGLTSVVAPAWQVSPQSTVHLGLGVPRGQGQVIVEPGERSAQARRAGQGGEERPQAAGKGREVGTRRPGGRGLTRMMRTLYMRVSRSSLSSEL